jgi:hypothetical protein
VGRGIEAVIRLAWFDDDGERYCTIRTDFGGNNDAPNLASIIRLLLQCVDHGLVDVSAKGYANRSSLVPAVGASDWKKFDRRVPGMLSSLGVRVLYHLR